MAAEVQILLKATDQASAVINKVTGNTEKLEKAAGGGNAAFKKLAGGANEVVQGLTGLNLGAIGAAGAIVALGKGVSDTVKEYSDYVEQIDKVSMRTGMASDEVSRLLQVADDFRVEMSTMENAMSMAVQNGFVPTTENLAKLADELKGIQDPVERSNRLQEIFGRQWREIVPLLDKGGAAIRSAAAGIADGLVVTQQAIDANREYQKAIDDMGDSWTAYKYALTKDAMPAMADYLNMQVKLSAGELQSGNMYDKKAEQMRLKAMYTYEASDAAKAYADRLAEQGEAEKALGERSSAIAEHMKSLGTATANAAVNWELYKRQQDNVAASTGVQTMMDNLSVSIDNQRVKLNDLIQSSQQFAQNLGGEAVSGLNEATLGQDRYEAALSAVDSATGSSLRSQHEQQEAIAALNAEYTNTNMTAEEYKTKLGEITSQFDPFQTQIQTAKDQLASLEAQLRHMEGTLTINVAYSGPGGTGSGGGGGTQGAGGSSSGAGGGGGNTGNIYEYATGGDFTVPAGYPNDSYLMAVSTGEHVTVTPPGRTAGATNSVSVNVYATIANQVDVYQMAHAVADVIQRRAR